MRPSTFGLCLLVALSCESPARARTLAVVPLSHQREAASRDVDASSRQLAALLSAAGWSVLESEAVLDQLFGAGPRVQLRKQQLRRFHQLARQGREQLNGLELAGAEVSLSRALELTPRIGAWLTSPRELAQVRFLLGLVYQRTEQPQRAARAYRRAAALDPDFMPSPTEYPPEILKEFSTARQENQQAEVCPLQLRSFPSGARVHVDGRALGLTPLKVKLPLGEHYLLLERQGHAPASRAVRPCSETTLIVALRKRPKLPRPDQLIQTLKVNGVHTAALIGEALGAEALVFTRRVQHQGKDRLWFKACRHLAAEEGDITCAEGTLAPHQLDSSDPIPLVASVKQREAANPWYTRWWIWTALGVAATTAVVLPLALSSPQTKYVVTQESALIRW